MIDERRHGLQSDRRLWDKASRVSIIGRLLPSCIGNFSSVPHAMVNVMSVAFK